MTTPFAGASISTVAGAVMTGDPDAAHALARQVSHYAGQAQTARQQISGELETVTSAWRGPTGQHFADALTALTSYLDDLHHHSLAVGRAPDWFAAAGEALTSAQTTMPSTLSVDAAARHDETGARAMAPAGYHAYVAAENTAARRTGDTLADRYRTISAKISAPPPAPAVAGNQVAANTPDPAQSVPVPRHAAANQDQPSARSQPVGADHTGQIAAGAGYAQLVTAPPSGARHALPDNAAAALLGPRHAVAAAPATMITPVNPTPASPLWGTIAAAALPAEGLIAAAAARRWYAPTPPNTALPRGLVRAEIRAERRALATAEQRALAQAEAGATRQAETAAATRTNTRASMPHGVLGNRAAERTTWLTEDRDLWATRNCVQPVIRNSRAASNTRPGQPD